MLYKCKICKKKINRFYLELSKCKCNNVYCDEHICSSKHNCIYNYKEKNKLEIIDKLPLVKHNKSVII